MAQVLVTGASGYIGGRLVPELVDAGHQVRCLARTPSKLDDQVWRDTVEVAEGDVTDESSLVEALDGVDAAYFLVHSMGAKAEFDEEDRKAAATFRDACATGGVARIVYLGGLGRDDDPDLSRHLQSRHEVGRVLADGPVPVTELRAAIIIGSGSASFEMLRYLVEVLPVMTTPKWVDNRCQPIAIRDVLAWLVGSIDDVRGHGDGASGASTSGGGASDVGGSGDGSGDDTEDHVHEIGGPDVLTYRTMMLAYAEAAGLARRRIVVVPVLTPSLSSRWVGLVTPLPSDLARPLVESLINEVVVNDPPAHVPFDRAPMPFREAVDLALRRAGELQVTTRWSDAGLRRRASAQPMPTDPEWAGGSVLVDAREATCDASPSALFAAVSGIGGERGWYVPPFLWNVRGWADELIGGAGIRRGRRHPDDLRLGDPVDCWRVETLEPDVLVRLRAEMKLPGDAWIEWRIEPSDDGGSTLDQRATFYPRGLLGRLYWYGLRPIHALAFARMARKIGAAAEVRAPKVDARSGAAHRAPA